MKDKMSIQTKDLILRIRIKIFKASQFLSDTKGVKLSKESYRLRKTKSHANCSDASKPTSNIITVGVWYPFELLFPDMMVDDDIIDISDLTTY